MSLRKNVNNVVRDIPKWDYSEASVVESKDNAGVSRDLYKLPDVVHIHNHVSPVYFYHYRPKNYSNKALLISYPILGGEMVKDKKGKPYFDGKVSKAIAWFAAKFLGMNAIVVATNNQLIFNPEYSAKDIKLELENVALNHIQVHDFIRNSGYFDYMNFDKVHHVGASLGAITAVMVCGITQWYSSLTAIVGGAPLAEVMAYSKEEPVRKYFDGAMWNFDKSRETLLSEIEQEIKSLDTQDTARMLMRNKVYMVLGLFDDSVPNNILKRKIPNTGFKLKKYAHDPKTDVYPTGHKTIALALPVWLPRMIKHIKKHGGA